MSSEDGLRRRRELQNGSASKTEHADTCIGRKGGVKKFGSVQWLSTHKNAALLSFVYLAIGLAWGFNKYLATPSVLPEEYILCTDTRFGIYTVDDESSVVQCIGVNGSLIFDRGLLYDIQQRWVAKNPGRRVDDIEMRTVEPGSIVVPGMSDSHAHILEHGASLVIPLYQAQNAHEAVKIVKDFVTGAPEVRDDPSKIIEGWGWNHMGWAGRAWPTAADFDSEPILRGRKIVLQSKDGHALWVSSTIIEMMGNIPEEIDGGVWTRTADGKPAGVFIDKAQDVVPKSPLTDENLRRRFLAAVNDGLRKGLTSIHDAGFSPVSLDFFRREAAKEPLPIRVYGMRYFDDENEYWGDKAEKVIDEGRLTSKSVKMFADGALRSGYAALNEPYTDDHHNHGVMRISPETLNKMLPRFLRDGWQVNIHAIGDRANGIVLDAFESALQGLNVSDLRPRLEHAQILTPEHIQRIASLGLIASIQPTHAISDMLFAEERLGPERSKGIYAFRSLLNAGAMLAFGSDSPVEDLNPLSGFYAAITRLSPQGDSPHGPEGWFAEQRLTREEALRGMTINPAYASFSEDVLGSLEIGKRADYVVLSQDIMRIPTNAILHTVVEATVIDGRVAYGKV